jgi:hypothetical protein
MIPNVATSTSMSGNSPGFCDYSRFPADSCGWIVADFEQVLCLDVSMAKLSV